MNLYKLKMRFKNTATATLRYVFLIGISFIILYPILLTFIISFMNSSDIYDSAVRFIPKRIMIENYEYGAILLDYGKNVMMSIGLNLLLCTIEMISCLLISYGFARFKFKGATILFGAVLLTLLVPANIYFVPLYLQLKDYGPMHWNFIGTPIPLFFMSLTGIGLRDGLNIYIMRQSLSGYPRALEEAAEIDGANSLQILTKIMLPGTSSVLATSFMFAFVWKWTDPTYTELFIPNTEFLWTKLSTISQTLQLLPENLRNDNYYTAIMKNACTMLFIIPLIVLFVIFKRFLVQSVETTGLVG